MPDFAVYQLSFFFIVSQSCRLGLPGDTPPGFVDPLFIFESVQFNRLQDLSKYTMPYVQLKVACVMTAGMFLHSDFLLISYKCSSVYAMLVCIDFLFYFKY